MEDCNNTEINFVTFFLQKFTHQIKQKKNSLVSVTFCRYV